MATANINVIARTPEVTIAVAEVLANPGVKVLTTNIQQAPFTIAGEPLDLVVGVNNLGGENVPDPGLFKFLGVETSTKEQVALQPQKLETDRAKTFTSITLNAIKQLSTSINNFETLAFASTSSFIISASISELVSLQADKSITNSTAHSETATFDSRKELASIVEPLDTISTQWDINPTIDIKATALDLITTQWDIFRSFHDTGYFLQDYVLEKDYLTYTPRAKDLSTLDIGKNIVSSFTKLDSLMKLEVVKPVVEPIKVIETLAKALIAHQYSNITATDDVLGTANIDDDQYALINKVFVNNTSNFESVAAVIQKIVLTAVNTDSQLYSTVEKSIETSASTTNLIYTAAQKLLETSASTSTNIVKILDTYLSAKAEANDTLGWSGSKHLVTQAMQSSTAELFHQNYFAQDYTPQKYVGYTYYGV